MQGRQYATLKPVLDILSELNLQDESVYDSVLQACDTGQPGELEAALATVRYCRARAEQGLRAVPDAMAHSNACESVAPRWVPPSRAGCSAS